MEQKTRLIHAAVFVQFLKSKRRQEDDDEDDEKISPKTSAII